MGSAHVRAPVTWEVSGGIPSDARCFDGHFPGNPLVPGAVLLAHAALRLGEIGVAVVSVRRMVFLAPLAPDKTFEISVLPKETGLEIRWHTGQVLIAQARAQVSEIND